MPTPPKPRLGRPPSLDPRTLLHARVSGITRKRLDAECKRTGMVLGRLLDRLAETLP